jgi:hypothetical protein
LRGTRLFLLVQASGTVSEVSAGSRAFEDVVLRALALAMAAAVVLKRVAVELRVEFVPCVL